MSAITSQITGVAIVCSTVCSGAEGIPPDRRFPSQSTSNSENASIWWRHHDGGHFVEASLCQIQFLAEKHDRRPLCPLSFTMIYATKTKDSMTGVGYLHPEILDDDEIRQSFVVSQACGAFKKRTWAPNRTLQFQLHVKTLKNTSFNIWARNLVWNFKGTLWNSTQNILPIQWTMCILYKGGSLRTLRVHKHFWNAPWCSQ